jgi:hypothetical protein
MGRDADDMTEREIRERIVRLGFGGDRALFDEFRERLRAALPSGTRVVIRGSVLTNERWSDGEPFDADGSGTSDLDVTFVGDEVKDCWESGAFYLPSVHTRPLSDKDPSVAPRLNPLREELQRLVGRPVNFQATSDLVLFARDVLLGQPYHVLVEPEGEP